MMLKSTGRGAVVAPHKPSLTLAHKECLKVSFRKEYGKKGQAALLESTDRAESLGPVRVGPEDPFHLMPVAS